LGDSPQKHPYTFALHQKAKGMTTITTQIEGISAADLLDGIKKIVKQAVSDYTPQPQPQPDDIWLTRQEVAKLFAISLPTVHAWMDAGIIKPYKLGTKTRFKKTEIMAAPKPIPSRYTKKKEVGND